MKNLDLIIVGNKIQFFEAAPAKSKSEPKTYLDIGHSGDVDYKLWIWDGKNKKLHVSKTFKKGKGNEWKSGSHGYWVKNLDIDDPWSHGNYSGRFEIQTGRLSIAPGEYEILEYLDKKLIDKLFDAFPNIKEVYYVPDLGKIKKIKLHDYIQEEKNI